MPDNRHARRVRTQVVLLRRLTIVVIVVLAVGVMLMTFPTVRGIGAGVLTSAGVVGVVAALAAQSLLGNVFAGLQLAFSDAVRLDDVVVVEGEWGRIEELTLSYVVVQIWDDRRLILPTSYFTSKPFQNWTRTEAAVLGTAEFDVDWSIPVQSMREELRRLVEGTELWDGRVCVLQVTDATGGTVKVRALVSAADAGSLWDLRCLVREHLVGLGPRPPPDRDAPDAYRAGRLLRQPALAVGAAAPAGPPPLRRRGCPTTPGSSAAATTATPAARPSSAPIRTRPGRRPQRGLRRPRSGRPGRSSTSVVGPPGVSGRRPHDQRRPGRRPRAEPRERGRAGPSTSAPGRARCPP